MNEINSIPVITVTARNVDQLSDVILSEIEHADFIAVDQVKLPGWLFWDSLFTFLLVSCHPLPFLLQELSGLGNTAGRARLDMTNYYGKLREAAEGYRVIRLCFD